MTESEVLKIFENEVIILDCWIEHCKDIIADCETEEDEFDDNKEGAELSLKDYSERKELFETAISALKEIQQYREIGTLEECREAVEKQKPKTPDYEGDGYADGYMVYDTWICPNCGAKYEVDYDDYKYCPECGQAIDENLEGMEDE